MRNHRLHRIPDVLLHRYYTIDVIQLHKLFMYEIILCVSYIRSEQIVPITDCAVFSTLACASRCARLL